VAEQEAADAAQADEVSFACYLVLSTNSLICIASHNEFIPTATLTALLLLALILLPPH
jgi:hypothetical protein